MTCLPEHYVPRCGNCWTQKIQVQMKTKGLTKAERTLPACIWLAFSWCQHYLTPAKQLMQLCHMFVHIQMQFRASAVVKMKLEPAIFHSWRIPHYPTWWTKQMFSCKRKLQIFLCILKVPNERQVVGVGVGVHTFTLAFPVASSVINSYVFPLCFC